MRRLPLQLFADYPKLLGLTDLNWEYSNRPLPYQGNNYPGCLSETTTDEYGNTVNYCFGDAVAFGLWDDLFIYQGTQQGIYYEVDGAAPNRRTSFEFYISHFSDQSQYYHFLMNFYENKPNVINYQYLNVSDHGVSATVGVQSFSGMFSLSSFLSAPVSVLLLMPLVVISPRIHAILFQPSSHLPGYAVDIQHHTWRRKLYYRRSW